MSKIKSDDSKALKTTKESELTMKIREDISEGTLNKAGMK